MTSKNTNSDTEKEIKFFRSSIADLLRKHNDTGITLYTQFLTEYEISLVSSLLKNKCVYSSWGGYCFSERRIISLGNSDISDFPVSCIEVSNNERSVSLTHRNILGSLMSVGIERNVTGDILIKNDHLAYIFCLNRMVKFICENLSKISRDDCFLKVVDIDSSELPEQRFETVIVSVSSLRIDCFISAVTGVSRTRAKEMFSHNLVFLNSCLIHDSERNIQESDIISIRGYGRFIINSYIRTNRKGKLQFEIRKFI